MAVWQLDDELWFPDPQWGEDSGLVAVGGDLSVERLLLAYSNGFFPWYAFNTPRRGSATTPRRGSATTANEPHWYCPLDRFVIFPSEIHISHSMKQLLRQHKYEVTINKDFEGVIRGCSTAQQRDKQRGACLGPDIINAYTELHHQHYAASVEVWEPPTADSQERRLVGGLYGVTLYRAFFGESMFSLVPNASKLALIHLAMVLDAIGGSFIDCQFETPHLASMGGRHITYKQYMEILKAKA